jgi:hypothetical protein
MKCADGRQTWSPNYAKENLTTKMLPLCTHDTCDDLMTFPNSLESTTVVSRTD